VLLEQLYRCEPYEIPATALDNLHKLLPLLNGLELIFGQPLSITSGFRTKKEHIRVYQEINDRRIIAGKPEVCIPIHSQHLLGNAADISDIAGDLKIFIYHHLYYFDDNDLYMEAFESTPSWVHIQRVPPRSGNRFFIP
jgi:hypothetical protein